MTDIIIRSNEIEMVPITTPVPYEKNMHIHSDEQIERLCKLIEYQGFRNPLVLQKGTNRIACGHGRLLAAQKIGMKEVPVVYQEFESEEQFYAYVVSDNAIGKDSWAQLDLSKINLDFLDLGPELDIDMLGLKDFVIEPIEKFDPGCDEDEVPEVENPITKRGDVWLLGKHRLMCGDSTMIDDVEKLMNGEKAELLFTSPPYSDMREYNGDKDLNVDGLVEFITAFSHISKYQAINLGIQRKNNEVYDYWTPYIEKAKENNYLFLSWNIWDKGEAGSIGNQTASFPLCHEWIFIFGKDKIDINCNKKNKDFGNKNHGTIRNKDGSTSPVTNTRKTREFGKRGTVTHLTPHKHTNKNPSVHPAMFPVELAEIYIEDMTGERDNVVEPFMGSGSTLIACEKTNRQCHGMELDEKYCDVIINRYMKYTNRDDVTLESTGQKYNELKAAQDV